MAFDNNGIFGLPPSYFVETGDTVLPSQHNPPFEAVASGLSQVYVKDGRAPMLGNLDLGGFRGINAADGINSGDLVTMAQLNAVIAQIAAAQLPVGSVLPGRWTSAPAGYLLENGGTIGSAASGGTTRANADTQALFTHLWTQFSQAILPIQSSTGAASTRGASAAADFAANKRMPLFDSRTRFLRGSDSGLNFDATLTVGSAQADVIKNHVHPGTTNNNSTPMTVTGTRPTTQQDSINPGNEIAMWSDGTVNVNRDINNDPHNHTFTTDNNTAGSALETRPRASVVLFCIKL